MQQPLPPPPFSISPGNPILRNSKHCELDTGNNDNLKYKLIILRQIEGNNSECITWSARARTISIFESRIISGKGRLKWG